MTALGIPGADALFNSAQARSLPRRCTTDEHRAFTAPDGDDLEVVDDEDEELDLVAEHDDPDHIVEDDEELIHDGEAGSEDIEESLDVLLAARLQTDRSDDEERNDDNDGKDYRKGSAEIIPMRRGDEFVCRSCFLIKRNGQLSDPAQELCLDCCA